jgi:hypothetical protein
MRLAGYSAHRASNGHEKEQLSAAFRTMGELTPRSERRHSRLCPSEAEPPRWRVSSHCRRSPASETAKRVGGILAAGSYRFGCFF